MKKFITGEQTGKKVNAASVARSMIKARDTNGERLFTSAEFLTCQQIASYFSRLASKRTIQGGNSSQSDSADESAEAEMVFKGATSRYFESFSVTCKITFSVRETTKY